MSRHQLAIKLSRVTSAMRHGLRWGIAIAAVRIPLVWISAVGLQQSGQGQVVGYFIAMLNSSIEMLLVRPWRNDVWAWATMVSGLVAITSMALGVLLVAIVQMFRGHR